MVKNLPASGGDAGGMGLMPGWGKAPGEGNGSQLQCYCQEIPRIQEPDGLHSPGITKSWWTGLSDSALTQPYFIFTHMFTILGLFIPLCIYGFAPDIIFIMPTGLLSVFLIIVLLAIHFFCFWMSEKIHFLSIFKDIFTEYRIPHWHVFPLLCSTSKIILHCILECIIFSKKSAIALLLVPLFIMWLFPFSYDMYQYHFNHISYA